MLERSIHCNGPLSLRSSSFLTNLRTSSRQIFFPVENTGANQILHRKSPVSGDLQNKLGIFFDPWAAMDRALGHDPAAALFHPVYASQNRPVLRTKSTVSRIFATLLSLRWLPCFCAWNPGTFGVKLWRCSMSRIPDSVHFTPVSFFIWRTGCFGKIPFLTPAKNSVILWFTNFVGRPDLGSSCKPTVPNFLNRAAQFLIELYDLWNSRAIIGIVLHSSTTLDTASILSFVFGFDSFLYASVNSACCFFTMDDKRFKL